MRLFYSKRHSEADQSATARAGEKFDVTVDQLGSFAHGNQTHSLALAHRWKSDALIFHFENDCLGLIAKTHVGLFRFRVAGDIVESLLQHAVKMNRDIAVDVSAGTALLVSYCDSVLLFKSWEIDAERAFKSGVVEHHGMQRLRERADFVERGLHDVAHLFEVGSQSGIDGWNPASGALQHGANGGEDLAEFVMQFAGNVAEGVFLNRNQLLGQFAAALGESGHLIEHFAVVLYKVQAGGDDQNEHRSEEDIGVLFDAGVDLLRLCRGLLFVGVIFDQEPRDRSDQAFLAGLERETDLRAGFGFLSGGGERENPIEGVPKLVDRKREISPLTRGRGGECLFARERVIQISADPLELRLPRRERIRLGLLEHVAHDEGERVEIVLDPQQEERIGAIAVDGFRLQAAQAVELDDGVGGVNGDGGESDGESREQADGGGAAGGHRFIMGDWGLGTGDSGLGTGDRGLGTGDCDLFGAYRVFCVTGAWVRIWLKKYALVESLWAW